VADGTVDVILSNCVINLSPTRPQVFREAFRVLKPGGRLAISDVVATARCPRAREPTSPRSPAASPARRASTTLRALLRAAGLQRASASTSTPQSREFIREWMPGSGVEDYVASATIEAVKPGGKAVVLRARPAARRGLGVIVLGPLVTRPTDAARAARGGRARGAKLRPFVARRVRAAADVDDVMQDIFLRMQRGLAARCGTTSASGPGSTRSPAAPSSTTAASAARHPVADAPASARRRPRRAPTRTTARSSASCSRCTSRPSSRCCRRRTARRSPSPSSGLTQKEAAEMLGVSLSA
jgi:hypothetical protein